MHDPCIETHTHHKRAIFCTLEFQLTENWTAFRFQNHQILFKNLVKILERRDLKLGYFVHAIFLYEVTHI